MSSQFKHIEMPDKVRLNIGSRIFERVAHASLCAEMNDSIKFYMLHRSIKGDVISEIELDKAKAITKSRFQRGNSIAFQRHLIIIVKVIYAEYIVTSLGKPYCDVKANEACGASNKKIAQNVSRHCNKSLPSPIEPMPHRSRDPIKVGSVVNPGRGLFLADMRAKRVLGGANPVHCPLSLMRCTKTCDDKISRKKVLM